MPDAQLVDMKYTPKERKEEKAEMTAYEPPPYPWGLCIRLEKDELAKLGITDLPNVGGEVHFTAVAKVTGVNQSASMQEEETCVAMQITMMAVTAVEPAAEEAGEGAQTPAKEKAERGGSLLGKYTRD